MVVVFKDALHVYMFSMVCWFLDPSFLVTLCYITCLEFRNHTTVYFCVTYKRFVHIVKIAVG